MAGTGFFKVGTIILILAFIIHMAGFATPKWTVVDILGGLGSYYTGLWQHCFSLFGAVSGCDGQRLDGPGWYRSTQALESIGALGLFISGIISLVLVCSEREKSLKAVNIIIMVGSGVCIVIGIVVYAVEESSALDQLFASVPVANIVDDKLGYSFYLCAVAGGLCLLFCFPLFVIDYCSKTGQPALQLPVQYSNQGGVIVASSTQPQVKQARKQQPYEYQQPQVHGRPVQYEYQQPNVHGRPVQYEYQQPYVHGRPVQYQYQQPYVRGQHPPFDQMPHHANW